MPTNESTAKFKADISELKSAMQEAARSVRVANSEFKATSASMEDWQHDADGLSAKLKQLNTVYDAQKTQLTSLEKQLELTVKEYGANSKGADDLRIKINNQKAAISGTEKQIKKYSDSLDEVKKSSEYLQGESERLTQKLKSVQEEFGKNSKEAKEVKQELKQVKKELKDTGDTAEEAADDVGKLEGGFSVLKGTLSNLLASGIKSIVGGIANAVTETKEYREELGMLEANANATGNAMDNVKRNFDEVAAITNDTGAAVEGLSNLMQAGFSKSALNTITDNLMGAAIKWKDTLKFEGLSDGLQETLATGAATGSFGEMLERMGMNLDDFNAGLQAANTSAEKQQYILDVLAKTGLADVKKGYEETNKDIIEANLAQRKMDDAWAGMAQKAQPVFTAIKNGFADLLLGASGFLEGVNGEKIATEVKKGFGYLTETILPAVKDGFGWIIDNKDILISAAVGLGAAFVTMNVANMVMGVVGAFKAFKTAQEGATVAQWLLNAAMSANPIGILIALIVGLVAGFVTLWNTSEGFRDFMIGAWDAVKGAFAAAWEWIVNFVTQTIPEAFNGMLDFFKALPGKIGEFFTNAKTVVFTWATDMVTKAKETGTNFLNSIVQFFSQLPYKIGYFIGNAIGSVIKWRADMIEKAKETGSKFLSNIVTFFKQLPGNILSFLTNAITTVVTWRAQMIQRAIEVGSQFLTNIINYLRNLPGNIANIVSNALSSVSQWASNMRSKGAEAARGLFDSVVNGLINLPNRVMSIGSDVVRGVWNGISNMGSWFANKVRNFASGIIDGMKDALKIGSPSKVAEMDIGRWVPEGVAVGIKKYTKKATAAAQAMSDKLIPAATTLKNGVSEKLASVKRSILGTTSGSGGVTNNYNFTQNNNSPKALSRQDVYRQTKNLLGAATA